MTYQLSLGAIFFNWDRNRIENFYKKVADDSVLDTLYVGEVVCTKRPNFDFSLWKDIIKNLQNSGKKVIFSTPAILSNKNEIKIIKKIIDDNPELLIEANDTSLLGITKPYAVGQLMNIYNESAIEFLEKYNIQEITLPSEIPLKALKTLVESTNIKLGVQVFGRLPLALSLRCYHARANNLHKANCNFVCGNDLDGLAVSTLEEQNIFAVNGIQTLSHSYCNLINELQDLMRIGINNFRFSPHSEVDILEISRIFKQYLDNKISLQEANIKINEETKNTDFVNGFFYEKPGMELVQNI